VNLGRRAGLTGIVVVTCAALLGAQSAKLSKADAAHFQAKLTLIEKNAATPVKRGAAARKTVVTDGEVNAI